MQSQSSRSTYLTDGGVGVERRSEPVSYERAIEPVIDALDERPGVLLASGYEYPGRYSRWDIGFVDPPLQLWSREREFGAVALNGRGRVLLAAVHRALRDLPAVESLRAESDELLAQIRTPSQHFAEEERSKQFSVFSLLRAIVAQFSSREDSSLGLYGAFGYDLAFQFEAVPLHQVRAPDRRDLLLYLPDQIFVVDHHARTATRHSYEFQVDGQDTTGLARTAPVAPYKGATQVAARRDHEPGEYAELVRRTQAWFGRGDLFEVVPGQSFFEPCPSPPSAVFRRLRESNPAPYATLMNLGQQEYLVGASPEMYLRCRGRRIETCPISGTIARGADALSDAEQILKLLSSEKEHAELTMCTDVDRNDKSRVCEPGSVRVIGRRQIELYSRVIHTVDHVEGTLRPEFDAMDAFLSHAWAVTVTGAPKLWAMRYIEEHERSPRAWYGGALGYLGFDGGINTGLTLRTMRVKDGVAEVRAGGTLLIDAVPESEERETEMKASALLDALARAAPGAACTQPAAPRPRVGAGRRVLLLDHEDSFVNTLSDYFRQTGAEVSTLRVLGDREQREARLREAQPDLVVLSPGPGTPSTFDAAATVGIATKLGLPLFGVCLGLQAIVEHWGGELRLLSHPVHGKESEIIVRGGRLFEGLPQRFKAGRYHSLHADVERLPDELEMTAQADDAVLMAIEHRSLPVAGVQFHPESILTGPGDAGLRLVQNVIRALASP